VQCSGLVGVTEHLHHACKVVVCQAAAETGIGLSEHLRRLKALRLADDNLLHVGGDNSRGAVAIDVIVAPGLKSLHERSLASIAARDDGQIAALTVGMYG